MTQSFDLKMKLSSRARSHQLAWLEGASTKMLIAFVGTHIESLSGRDYRESSPQDAPRLMTSWSGVCSAVGFYMHAVLAIWNACEPIETRLFRRLASILRDDLETSNPRNFPGKGISTDLWFWKAFMGALGAEKCSSNPMWELRCAFEAFIRDWSVFSSVMSWTQARDTLRSIVWPESSHLEGEAKALWERSVL